MKRLVCYCFSLYDHKERTDLCSAKTVHTANYTLVKETKYFIIVCQKYSAIIRKGRWLSLSLVTVSNHTFD